MSYLTDEQSAHSGKPIELYKFQGTHASFRYTTAPIDIIYNSETYTAIAMTRSAINIGSQNEDGLSLTIEMSVFQSLIQAYAFQVAPPKLQLTVYRYHDQSDVQIYFVGSIDNVTVNDGKGVVKSTAYLSSVLSQSVPDVYIQSHCNNTLYDSICGINRNSWKQDTTISSINGRTIVVGSVGTLNGKLIGGEMVHSSGESRMIISQTGTTIIVNYPFTSFVETSDSVTIAAGCNYKRLGDCKNRFNNVARYNGFDFVEGENLFEKGLTPGKYLDMDPCLHPTFAAGKDWIGLRMEYSHLGQGTWGNQIIDVGPYIQPDVATAILSNGPNADEYNNEDELCWSFRSYDLPNWTWYNYQPDPYRHGHYEILLQFAPDFFPSELPVHGNLYVIYPDGSAKWLLQTPDVSVIWTNRVTFTI